MPLSLSYEFSETPTHAYVRLPLRGRAAALDVSAWQQWLRVRAGAYLLEVDLAAPVHGDALVNVSEAAKEVIITLQKRERGLWGTLVSSADADTRSQLRAASIQAWTEEQEKLRAERAGTKDALKRFALSEQLATEDRARAHLDATIAEEKREATARVMTAPEAAGRDEGVERSGGDTARKVVARPTPPVRRLPPPRHARAAALRVAADVRVSGGRDADVLEAEHAGRAAVTTLRAGVKFTPRLFPTPLRESTVAQELAWLGKNGSHILRLQRGGRAGHVGFANSDVEWLKSRGDDFFRQGDHASASNAYAAAITASEVALKRARPDLLLNRAACYLALGRLVECLADCDGCLAQDESLTPALRTKGMVRKALALWWSGEHRRCLEFLCSALDDPKLQADRDILEPLHASATHALSQLEVKALADTALRERRWEEAVAQYSALLAEVPSSFRVAANLATALCRRGEWKRAYALLQSAKEWSRAASAQTLRAACGIDAPLTVDETRVLDDKLSFVSTVLAHHTGVQ